MSLEKPHLATNSTALKIRIMKLVLRSTGCCPVDLSSKYSNQCTLLIQTGKRLLSHKKGAYMYARLKFNLKVLYHGHVKGTWLDTNYGQVFLGIGGDVCIEQFTKTSTGISDNV